MTADLDKLDALPYETGDIIEHGVVPCRDCGQPHDLRATEAHKHPRASWRADDGHTYRVMSAVEVTNLFVAAARERDELRAALELIAEDMHSYAIMADDMPLHPAVVWPICTDKRCVAVRTALNREAGT